MKIKFILFLLTIIFFAGIRASAISIYVSPGGNDANPGTADKPFATITAAIRYVRQLRKSQKLTSPVEVLVQRGTYNLTQPLILTPEDSGTKDAPLIIKGIEGSVPVISGGLMLKAFEKVSDKLWKVSIPEIAEYSGTLQQLYVNNKRAVRARTPNDGEYFKTKGATETLIDTSSRSTTKIAVQKIGLTAGQIKVLQSAKADMPNVVISLTHAWDRTRRYIQGLSIADSALFISGDPMQSFNRFTNTSQFIFENSKAFLDAPGEWFMEPGGTLYYVPRAGEKIETSQATIPVTDQLVIFKGSERQDVENIHFENLSFQYTRYIMPVSGNETAQAGAPTDATIMADHTQNISFNNCEIAHTGCNAIWFRAGCKNDKITNSYLHDLGVGGVKIGEIEVPADKEMLTRNITVDNNIIRSGGYEFPTGVGVLIFQASDNTISHNEIADFRYSGVSVGWIWGYAYSPTKRNKIIFNHIHHLGWGLLSDMGGVYTLGQSEGTIVSNNVIHDIYSYGYGGWGLYTDEGSTGITMSNNLVYNCKSSAFHQHYGKDNIISNNIFYSQIRAQLEATRVEDHHSFNFTHNIIYYDRGILIGKAAWAKIQTLADSNIYYDPRTKSAQFGSLTLKEWQKTTGKDLHSIIADPQFVDGAQHNFNFKSRKVINKIKFKPFDYTQAGVYGSLSWKKQAELDPEIVADFDKMLTKRLSEGEPK